MNDRVTFLKPSSGSLISSRQRWLRETHGAPGSYQQCVTWGKKTHPLRQSHLQFSLLEIHPDVFRSGIRRRS